MGTALALAGYLGRLDVDLKKRKDQIVSFALFLAPMGLANDIFDKQDARRHLRGR